jgi:hypothetical protein
MRAREKLQNGGLESDANCARKKCLRGKKLGTHSISSSWPVIAGLGFLRGFQPRSVGFLPLWEDRSRPAQKAPAITPR